MKASSPPPLACPLACPLRSRLFRRCSRKHTPTQAQALSRALYSQRIMFVTLLLPMCATGSGKTETVTKALERQAGACVSFLFLCCLSFVDHIGHCCVGWK